VAGSLKCPRCQATLTSAPDESGSIVCPQCGVKLRTRSTAVVRIQSNPATRATVPEHRAPDSDSVLARVEAKKSASATLPPGTPLKKIPRPEEHAAAAATLPTLEALLQEVQAVRRLQEEMLAILKSRPSGPSGPSVPVTPVDDPFAGFEGDVPAAPAAPAAVRSRRRKSVLLIDDDARVREAVVEALEHADVPVRTAVDGNGGLAAIATEKPDVIVLELGLGGSMAGKDVINMIKATMEWVDIPIVLHTRVPVANQKEARIEHGADDFIPKGPNSSPALVNRVIGLFRRG
jgi:CheY-like chemotaxis protein/DNA-directed RNA polymerase subunit RPC12/RpoP